MNINKKIKEKFYFKYITLFFLLTLYIPLIGIIITQFVRKDLFSITYMVFIIDFIISIILTNIYYKLDIENPIIRINTAFKGCSSLEKISVLPRIYHN